jgi:hypothetical protein
MYAGPPLDLLERDLSDSQVSSAHHAPVQAQGSSTDRFQACYGLCLL